MYGDQMLRIHFTADDLAKTRIAAAPDPLWEIACSLHRLQTRQGRWAYADWYQATRTKLADTGLDRVVRGLLGPLLPRAGYFPDFLTPAEAAHGFDAGLEAIMATRPQQVQDELTELERVRSVPPRLRRLTDRRQRRTLIHALRIYHATVIAPYREPMQARIDAERSLRARALLDGGIHGLLDSYNPTMRLRPPILEVNYHGLDNERDLHLYGRGLYLIPSYFCWNDPISLVDPALQPVLVYPLHRQHKSPSDCAARSASPPPLAALLGRSRASILRATATGATTTELARLAGVSTPAASQHIAVLRDNGLITSQRHANTVLHSLTPAGARLLRSRSEQDGAPRSELPAAANGVARSS
jgi:DNA-binding transcriptional ArsR family regulator